MSPVSSMGKKVFMMYGAIIFVNVLVLALSTRVNQFQDFFYIADLFPFALSIVTLVILVIMLLLDIGVKDSVTARPTFQIGIMFILSIFWLAFNAFSTSRWKEVPMNCSTIPADYSDTKHWCMDLQALKAFVWINWVLIFLGGCFAARFAVTQSQRGQKHIWSTPLSRFTRRASHTRSPTYAFTGSDVSQMSQTQNSFFSAH